MTRRKTFLETSLVQRKQANETFWKRLFFSSFIQTEEKERPKEQKQYHPFSMDPSNRTRRDHWTRKKFKPWRFESTISKKFVEPKIRRETSDIFLFMFQFKLHPEKRIEEAKLRSFIVKKTKSGPKKQAFVVENCSRWEKLCPSSLQNSSRQNRGQRTGSRSNDFSGTSIRWKFPVILL